METPLDVLSRAATLVETDRKEGEVGYSMGRHSDSVKELPSRVNRHRRSAERREGPLVMKCDGDHTHRTNSTAGISTRCASTQTLITSEMVGIPEINPDLPIPSSSNRVFEDDIDTPMTGIERGHHAPLPLLHRPHVLPHSHHPPPAYRHHNMPPQLHRPSVITCAPRPPPPRERLETGMLPLGPLSAPSPLYLNGRDRSRETGEPWPTASKPQQTSPSYNSDVDPDIEEHFRRSLGRDYQETFPSPPPSAKSPTPSSSSTSPTSRQPSITSPTTRPSSSPTGKQSLTSPSQRTSSSSPPTRRQSSSPPSRPSSSSSTIMEDMSVLNEVSITGSVDDHFAKALGEKWSQIKDVLEPSSASERSSPAASPSLRVSSSPVIQQQQAPVVS